MTMVFRLALFALLLYVKRMTGMDKPQNYVWGVGTVEKEYDETQLRFGKDGWQREVVSQQKQADVATALASLHMPEIMKAATIRALRESVGKKRGEHLHLDKPDTPEIQQATTEETKVHRSYASSVDADLQEVFALTDESVAEIMEQMLDAVKESVQAVAEGDLSRAGAWFEIVLTESVELKRNFNRAGVRDNAAMHMLQKNEVTNLLRQTLEDAYASQIGQELRGLQPDQRSDFLNRIDAMIEMYLQPPRGMQM